MLSHVVGWPVAGRSQRIQDTLAPSWKTRGGSSPAARSSDGRRRTALPVRPAPPVAGIAATACQSAQRRLRPSAMGRAFKLDFAQTGRSLEGDEVPPGHHGSPGRDLWRDLGARKKTEGKIRKPFVCGPVQPVRPSRSRRETHRLGLPRRALDIDMTAASSPGSGATRVLNCILAHHAIDRPACRRIAQASAATSSAGSGYLAAVHRGDHLNVSDPRPKDLPVVVHAPKRARHVRLTTRRKHVR
jgi:hypothetical protein